VDGSGAVRLDLGKGFFFNRGDDDVVSLRTSSVEDEEWEASVAGNETESSTLGNWRIQSISPTSMLASLLDV